MPRHFILTPTPLKLLFPFTLLAALAFSVSDASDAIAGPNEAIVDMTFESDSDLTVGASSAVTVKATLSRDLNHSSALGGAQVVLDLVEVGARGELRESIQRLASAVTQPNGRATLTFRAPRTVTPRVALRVRVRSSHGERTMSRTVSISENVLVHLRTDRGRYQPGGQLRWRTTVVHGLDAHGIVGVDVDVTIRNPKDTSIWRGTMKTDKGGMASGAVPLAADVMVGRYTIEARVRGRGASTKEYVDVAAYELAPFAVTVETTPKFPKPGEEVLATITARYPHGEPVSGVATISAGVGRVELADRKLNLDEFGRARLRFVPTIGETAVVNGTVVDGANRRVTFNHPIALPGAPMRLAVVPASPVLTPGTQRVYVISTDRRGVMVPSTVRLEWTGGVKRVEVDSPGAVMVPIAIREGFAGSLTIRASATARDGRVATAEGWATVTGTRDVSIEIAETVITAGGVVAVKARWPQRDGPVFATIIRNGVPLASKLVSFAGKSDVGSVRIKAPVGAFGLATMRLTEISFERKTGSLRPRVVGQTVYLRRAALGVSVDAQLRNQPGQTATARVVVQYPGGVPAAGVHLAASVVDERVLALSVERPNLGAVLDDTSSIVDGDRQAQHAGLVFADFLGRPASPANHVALAAILATLLPDNREPKLFASEADRVVAEAKRIAEADALIAETMFKSVASLGRAKGAAWEFAMPFGELLTSAGWTAAQTLDPWKRSTSWYYARVLRESMMFDRYARSVLERRFSGLEKRILKRLRKRGGPLRASAADVANAASHLRVDPWGTAIRVRNGHRNESDRVSLRSAGPDLQFGTKDDLVREFGRDGSGRYGMGSGRGGHRGRGARAPSVRIGSLAGASTMTTRKRFDETVMWRTGVVTNAKGVAELEIPLADSITGWQVDIEVVGARGAIGVARSRLETHRARYADVAAPSGLSVGDRYSVPIVVANHVATPANVVLKVEAKGAISIVGSQQISKTVDANAVAALPVEIKGVEPGSGIVSVTMFVGGKVVDAFEKEIRIEHAGELIRSTSSAVLNNGKATMSLDASAAADKTLTAMLRVSSGAFDRTIAGIDKLVREPTGCFEQTTSSTYPNIMALKVAGSSKHHQLSDRSRARARRFVSEGYQRMVSYEETGGGFSWFGRGNRSTALTAYALLAFEDMNGIYPVDPKVVSRARSFLRKMQRKDGSWGSGGRYSGNSDLIATAYIAWALAESGAGGASLSRALRYLNRRQKTVAKDPYALALWAAAESVGPKPRSTASRLLAKHIVGSGISAKVARSSELGPTHFYGNGPRIEAQATALGAIALWRTGKHAEASRLLHWLRGEGASLWSGSTQGTILALRALTLASSDAGRGTGRVKVVINGRDVGTIEVGKNAARGLDVSRFLRAGANTVALSGGSGALSATLDSRWRSKRVDATANGLVVTRQIKTKRLKRGQTVDVVVSVHNPGNVAVAMPMVIVPVPPGMRISDDGGKRVRRRAVASKIEDVGDERRYYLYDLGPGRKRVLEYTLVAESAADVLHRPVRSYAYYSPETSGSSSPGRLTTTP